MPVKPVAKSRKPIYFGIIAVVVFAAGVAIWVSHARKMAAAVETSNADIVAVDLGNVEKTVESAGRVVSNLDVDIKCRASGTVITLPFDISQKVKAGDLLCQLDRTDEDLAVRLAEAQLAQSTAKVQQSKDNLNQATLNLETTRRRTEAAVVSAKVKAQNAQSKADRQKQLIDQKLGSQEEYETAQTDAASAASDSAAADVAVEELKQQAIQLEYKRKDVTTAEAQQSADQITLDTQKQNLAYTTVTAPIDGTVSALDVQKGAIIASGTNAVNGGTTILTLSDLSRIFVMATVDQSDIGGVQEGQEARIRVDAYPDRTFVGKVVRIAAKGVSASNVVTVEVKVEVTDEFKHLLKPELTGTVTVVQDQRKGVVTIPAAAVIHKRGTFVKFADGTNHEVKLGLAGNDTVEVISGVKAGDKIHGNAGEAPTKWKNDDDDHHGPP